VSSASVLPFLFSVRSKKSLLVEWLTDVAIPIEKASSLTLVALGIMNFAWCWGMRECRATVSLRMVHLKKWWMMDRIRDIRGSSRRSVCAPVVVQGWWAPEALRSCWRIMAAVVRKARTRSAAPRQFEGERLVTMQALAIISRREKEAQLISPMLPSFVRELYLGLGVWC
jgi:hypothetical protein